LDGSRDRYLAHVDVELAQTLGEDADEFGFRGVLEADAVDSRKLRESIGLCRAEYAPASRSSTRVGPVGVQPRSSRVTVLVAARSMPKKVPIHPK